MFAYYDYSNFPIVKVILNNIIVNDEDFQNFTNQWLQLYYNKRDFEFIFDTKKCGLVNPKYCLYMALFIKKLKKEKIHYLKKSIIYVYNKYIFNLLKIIFYFEKPIAKVEIFLLENMENMENMENIENMENMENIKKYTINV